MNWDTYGLALAQAVAMKSKDPSTQCGCVILDGQQRVVSTGYNGLPRGVPDEGLLLLDRAVKLETVIHAEVNAVLFARTDLTGATAYVWPMPPCSRCAAVLIQAGVVRVVAPRPSAEQRERWGKSLELAAYLYRKRGVELVEYDGAEHAEFDNRNKNG